METLKIADLIRNPLLLNEETEVKLRQLIEQYPWFQPAHQLLLKNLKVLQKPIEEQLYQSAVYIFDRTFLYHYLNDSSICEPDALEVEEQSNQPIQSVIEQKKEIEFSDIPFEVVHPQVEEEQPVKTTNEVTDEPVPSQASSDNDILTLDESEPAIKHAETKDSKPKKRKGRKPARTHEFLEEEYTPDETSNDLIDQFLTKQPGIIRLNDPVQQPEIAAEPENLEPDDELATESLAQIYIKQGYYIKALVIYEKLRLKYPEKNAYFAEQIIELTKQINKS